MVSNIFSVTPLWENSHFDQYFTDGLKPPSSWFSVVCLVGFFNPDLLPLMFFHPGRMKAAELFHRMRCKWNSKNFVAWPVLVQSGPLLRVLIYGGVSPISRVITSVTYLSGHLSGLYPHL